MYREKGGILMKRRIAERIAAFGAIILLLGLCVYTFIRENPYPYKGAYKELYTAAIYSIPDAEGYMHHGEGAYSSDIHIWEQDAYGRTLYSYCEDYSNRVFALVLCQAYDEANVYVYPEVNYVLTLIDSKYYYESVEENHLKKKTEAFYLENRDRIKEENDWNKPLDKSKCVAYSITDHKVLGEDVAELSKAQCNEILNAYSETLHLANPEKRPHRWHRILQVDAEGKILHQISGVHRYYDNPNWREREEYTSYSITLWVITDRDGNYDKENGILVMYSKANESDKTFIYEASAILEFKNKNAWKYK
jgi:hypothetical protein